MKAIVMSCVTGSLALLVAVAAQAYLNKEVEARWNGYGSINFAASNDDLATGSVASASSGAVSSDAVSSDAVSSDAMSSDAIANLMAPVAEPKPALNPALLLESAPARRALLTAVAPEADHDCPPTAPTTAAPATAAPTTAAANVPAQTGAPDKEQRVAEVAAQVAPQATPQATPQVTPQVTRQITAQVTVTRAGTRQTVYTVVREKR